ncbi:putative Histone-lysine N-methyltransferase NSD3 [Quillaja saponaria]|uniref:Histone-lysine N-methyltransferase NSD3 n=1 Tax=Quillaja saponaria TaxID=32244 RepID=A0AAD7KRY5_QUISA|nr:putative Histone-lysine N-methyltransferase NSD3 [Quillaja saponaria]
MDREEKKRKFNEAVVNMLYPTPPPPPQVSSLCLSEFNSDDLDDSHSSSTSNDDGSEPESQKLTRAQRKRLRKKKLKEEASRRGNVIGPLLPLINPNESSDLVGKEESPAVRRNADEDLESGADKHGETACANSKKVKQRRMTKRITKEKLNSSNSESCDRQ